MQRNTLTKLGELRIGDRFCYPGKTDVWQVVAPVGKMKVAINQYDSSTGQRMHHFDILKPQNLQVKFLRHTILSFGEDGLVEMLKPGDVFTIGFDIIKEYMVREQYKDQASPKGECKAVKLDGSKDIIFIPHGKEISFVRSEKENQNEKV